MVGRVAGFLEQVELGYKCERYLGSKEREFKFLIWWFDMKGGNEVFRDWFPKGRVCGVLSGYSG